MEILFFLFLGKPLWMWLVFLTLVVSLLVFDLGVLHKDDHEIGVAESLKLSAMYITLGLSFAGFIWWQMDATATAHYLTAFVVEKTLAMDNIFVIALIFGFFAIPRQYQHRVLFWGMRSISCARNAAACEELTESSAVQHFFEAQQELKIGSKWARTGRKRTRTAL